MYFGSKSLHTHPQPSPLLSHTHPGVYVCMHMCVFVERDHAVLMLKEQQTRGNVLLHLCISGSNTILLPICSVCAYPA